MNARIRKKKEKQSIMECSFEIAPGYPYKKRKQVVNKSWKMYHDAEFKILIGYKRKTIE